MEMASQLFCPTRWFFSTKLLAGLDNAFTQYVLSCRILFYQPLTLATFFGDFVLIKALVGFNNANSIPDIRRTTTKVMDADNLE